jgi:ATP:ADP antiporter, AAA family
MIPVETHPPYSALRWIPYLKLFTDIRPREVRSTLILTLNFFLLFTAYYVLKPIREGLILSMNGGAELKSSATMVQAVLFIALVPFYSRVAARFTGRGAIISVYLFMSLNILILMILGLAGFRYVGIVYFIWIGFFNLVTISQTWSLCNELYSPETGKRNFPLIGLGAAIGATLGAMALRFVVPHIGLFKPMAIAAALLLICAALIRYGLPKQRRNGEQKAIETGVEQARHPFGGIAMVFKNRYIAFVAALILITNLINTNSEYMLGHLVADHFRAMIPEGTGRDDALRNAISEFYASFFFWVNISVLLTQAFAVSRIIKHLRIRGALYIMPILALFSYAVVLFLPLLLVVRLVKIAENASDYSLNNTAREMLYLPLATGEKYEAKLAADTIFRRVGDALSNPLVILSMETFGLGIGLFSGVNIALVLIWFWLVWKIGVKRRKMVDESGQ